MKKQHAVERVLLVDDERSILDAMTEVIRSLDLAVIVAEDGDEAWKKFEEEKPDIVVTDVRMPNRDGIALTTQIRSIHPSCPVIVMTGFGSEQAAVAALRAGASDYLVKPFQLKDMRLAVERACSLLCAHYAEYLVAPALLHVESCLTIDNHPEMVGGVVSHVLRSLTGFVSEPQMLGLRIALQEMLLNAIEHGNLNIKSEEKSQALMEDTYECLIEERRILKEYRDRRVRLFVEHDVQTGVVRLRIRDEGEGFDWKTVLTRRADELPKTGGSGRGIFLSKTMVSEVQYHGNGNEVTLCLAHSM